MKKLILTPEEKERGKPILVPESRNRYQYIIIYPAGNRSEYQGPLHEEPFVSIFPASTVICADPQYNTGNTHKGEEIALGEQLEINELGVHHLEKSPYCANLVVVRERDNFRCGY